MDDETSSHYIFLFMFLVIGSSIKANMHNCSIGDIIKHWMCELKENAIDIIKHWVCELKENAISAKAT